MNSKFQKYLYSKAAKYASLLLTLAAVVITVINIRNKDVYASFASGLFAFSALCLFLAITSELRHRQNDSNK